MFNKQSKHTYWSQITTCFIWLCYFEQKKLHALGKGACPIYLHESISLVLRRQPQLYSAYNFKLFIPQRSDYIMQLFRPATGQNKSQKLTRLICWGSDNVFLLCCMCVLVSNKPCIPLTVSSVWNQKSDYDVSLHQRIAPAHIIRSKV